nr:PREDICTED: serum amyloid A protein-like [Rhinolophus sinicus]XP_019570532.1 PREDICTED: serum amyloid A protein-like [Rhinolophus sinicus]XP_019570533.1 PREDICTED: serum amyloid A protein-like [Rhinolophus sinicus]
MKVFTIIIFCSLILGISSQTKPTFFSGFIEGVKAMQRAYSDMKEANFIGADKYFHARGNYDAAQHGRGGVAAAKLISDAREASDLLRSGDSGRGVEDSKADQRANKWGWSGRDPNYFRPPGLPSKY